MTLSKTLPLLAAVATLLGAGLLVGSGALAQDSLAGDSRQPLVDFEAEALSGERLRLSDYAGQVVVINFWATWCAPCLQELPFLQGFYETYADDGLVVLAIAIDGPETQSQVRREVRRRRLTMPIVLDMNGNLTSVLNPRIAAPFTVFVDRSGARAFSQEGYSSGDEIRYEALIQELLAEPPPETP